jgi:alpha-amylase/alpha-mannosidase (GH57 family)
MSLYVCVHGHFYQPPRENPWLEEVELQESAYPYHDWNDRITAECYAPNTASRIFDSEKRIIDIVNNYSRMSFNFGPSLLSWMERHRPDVYEALLEADRIGRERFSGHGGAVAQVYNHMIMPLANRRDKATQVIWGIRDFSKRFARPPEGMWLPETAVDIPSLEVLAQQGVSFTILAPHQAARTRPLGGKEWRDVQGGHVDPTMPYVCFLPSGRSIKLFFYDGPVSRDVAFGGLLANGEAFAARLMGAFSDDRAWPQLVHVATDGETYGHHHPMGDMALAYCLELVEKNHPAAITIYSEFLEKHPPTHEVQIVEKSSWSCIHGIERWRENCGCSSGMHSGWSQGWRRPLREAMNRLADRLAPFFEREAAGFLRDPWGARDDYIDVILDRSRENVEDFLARHAMRDLLHEEKSRVLMLLEMQRHAMLAFTSCGWFFDEISGIETTQVMRYAARAMQLAEKVWGVHLEDYFKEELEEARSNVPEFFNGARVYEMFVKPAGVDLMRVGAHLATASIFHNEQDSSRIFCYTAESEFHEKLDAESSTLSVGKAKIFSDITWEESTISFATVYQGGFDVTSGIRESMDPRVFDRMLDDVKGAFRKGGPFGALGTIDRHFGGHPYTFWHLFKDEQQRIVNGILDAEMTEIEASFRQIVERNVKVIAFLNEIQMPVPKALAVATEFIVNADLRKALDSDVPDVGRLETLVNESGSWGVKLNVSELSFAASGRMSDLTARICGNPKDVELMTLLDRLFILLKRLNVEPRLWKMQNIYFALSREMYPDFLEKAARGDAFAERWSSAFQVLGGHLRIRTV